MGEHPHGPGAYSGAFQTLMCLCITWDLVNCRSDSVALVWGLVLCPLKLQVQLPLMELEGVGWARWGLSPSSPRILFPPGELHFISLTPQAYSWPLWRVFTQSSRTRRWPLGKLFSMLWDCGLDLHIFAWLGQVVSGPSLMARSFFNLYLAKSSTSNKWKP